jgi:hypothetical protein
LAISVKMSAKSLLFTASPFQKTNKKSHHEGHYSAEAC